MRTKAERKALAADTLRGFCEPEALALVPEDDLLAAFQRLGEAVRALQAAPSLHHVVLRVGLSALANGR